MEFFYPIGENPENDPFLNGLPNGYKFAACIFYPFVKMQNDWKSEDDTYPTNEDLLRFGKLLSWEEIRKDSGLNNISEMSIAVTAAAVLADGYFGRKIYQRPDLAKKLDESLTENILYPMMDQISVFLIHRILSVLASKGAKSIKYATLYGEQGTHEIKDLNLETINLLCDDIITISDDNEELVFTCYFDEVQALFLQKKITERYWSEMGWRVLFLTKKLL
ncbi:hypothetical protein AC622_08790 [Bacillus sp. FJAT-27916]|uniref:DUF2711 family protein n=1 Tax=Bacillus sp. FJAT-27916 TaxID=1679169 RepID=UPI0006709AF2|nr:DUF2711 family protein [Bacillus sp. FJAT-27916]KMY44333.1 hypothetical protein AC622_08790 [Bacillus sp. FJAT-27916]